MGWNDLFGSKANCFPSRDVFEVLDYSNPFQETCPVLLVAMDLNEGEYLSAYIWEHLRLKTNKRKM